MTFIIAKCTHCQMIESLPADAMLVEAAPAEATDERIAGWARWICSTCCDLVGRELAWHELAPLLDAGARLVSEDVAECRPPHPEGPPTGAPFEPDDLLNLHELLAGDEWFEQLISRAR
jgi:hypothetical protein